jgi:hypothetical protein
MSNYRPLQGANRPLGHRLASWHGVADGNRRQQLRCRFPRVKSDLPRSKAKPHMMSSVRTKSIGRFRFVDSLPTGARLVEITRRVVISSAWTSLLLSGGFFGHTPVPKLVCKDSTNFRAVHTGSVFRWVPCTRTSRDREGAAPPAPSRSRLVGARGVRAATVRERGRSAPSRSRLVPMCATHRETVPDKQTRLDFADKPRGIG